MTPAETLQVIVDALGALLIPLVLFFLGQWFIRSKERSDSALREAGQLAAFLEHLASESRERRRLALLALTHMRNARLFPDQLLQAVQSIAARDDPEIAALANLALGRTSPRKNLTPEEHSLLFELLLPMKLHFDRTRHAFQAWVQTKATKPNLEIEDAIKDSNSVIRSILTNKWHLIPADLQVDALHLIGHYDAWLVEYDRVRPGGIRNPDVPYVFVGPRGSPFPVDAEKHFLEKYATMASESDA